MFLGSVDGSIVNVALPTLMKDFNADFAVIEWVTLSYLMGLAVLLVSMGRLADMVGKKRVFTSGIVLFLAGSALCGLAPSIYWLIGFRFLQSIGAAMVLALGVAILAETWPVQERGKAIGLASTFISLGIVIGPAIGGVMLQYLTWHWIFFVNIPVGAVALILALLYLPSLRPSGGREPFDIAGAVVLGVSLLAFTLAMTMGQNQGFADPWVLLLGAVSISAGAAFLWIEWRARYPMLDLRLFRVPQFSLNLFTAAMVFVAIAGVTLLLPFYLQEVMGEDLLMVGLLMAAVPLVMAFIQPVAGMLSDRRDTRLVSAVGLAFVLLGYLAMSTLRVDGTPLGFVVRMLPVAIGMGAFNSPNNSAIMSAVPRERLGVASGTLSMVRTLGQITGIAALSAFFDSRLSHYSGATVDLSNAAPAAIVAALHDQFVLVAALVAVALATALLTWRWEIRRGIVSIAKPQLSPAERALVDELPIIE